LSDKGELPIVYVKMYSCEGKKMLSDPQIRRLWEEWIGAETRAYWYAELSTRHQQRQRIITILNLVFSSGAAVLFFTSIGLAPYVAVLSAIASAISLAEQNYRRVIVADDLHSKWSRIALECTRLWESSFSDDAADGLWQIENMVFDASQSSVSAGFKLDAKAMAHWQDVVQMHHGVQSAKA